MHSIGLDVIEIKRIKDSISRWDIRFLNRIFTENEIQYCANRTPQLAARFAAKEATMKALGQGFTDIPWKDIEIVTNSSGAPSIQLYRKALRRYKELGFVGIAVSLSHSKELAMASVIGELNENSKY
ncbi:MAG: holo-ACP synthase [Chloroflexi bacterium]|nr:holo-ACP synthase [Chloroflexota bacterium]